MITPVAVPVWFMDAEGQQWQAWIVRARAVLSRTYIQACLIAAIKSLFQIFGHMPACRARACMHTPGEVYTVGV